MAQKPTHDTSKEHVSIVICGTVDSGKSTTTGHLLYKLDGFSKRDLEKYQAEADAVGKSSFAFAFVMDRHKEERARGVTINCTTEQFFTDKFHYSIVDAPGHADYIKNMIGGSSQADIALIMVPADGNFQSSICRAVDGKPEGQTRQHARLINLLGVKQIIVGVNKMDEKLAGYSEERFNEVAAEMRDMLVKVGWKQDFVTNSVPIIPISGLQGDNLFEVSDKMPWWKGHEVTKPDNDKVTIHTLYDALNNFVILPKRNSEGLLRCPIGQVIPANQKRPNILTGRIEQGTLKKGDEVVFVPSHTPANPCTGKIFSIEMHHKETDTSGPGDNIGFVVKGLDKGNMPRKGDIMIHKKDATLNKVKKFTAVVQVLEHPGSHKVGYTPQGYVRTAKSACKLTKINWHLGKATGGKKIEDPVEIKTGEAAEVEFEPQQPLVLDTFENCEGLGRIAIMDNLRVKMLGKITKVEH